MTNLARRSLPHLNTFDEYHIDRCHLPYVRLDNSRSPTWSIKGNFYRNSKDPYDRIIINVPSQLLHLVTHDNNSSPGVFYNKNDTAIIRINFHQSESDNFICDNDTSSYDDDDDDDDDDGFSINLHTD